LRELLEQEGFESWPKLTGGKGIHLMVPLSERMKHDAAHRRSKIIGEQLARPDPERFLLARGLDIRSRCPSHGKISRLGYDPTHLA
jgi:bifunctional non-homologous end joining protein LigD